MFLFYRVLCHCAPLALFDLVSLLVCKCVSSWSEVTTLISAYRGAVVVELAVKANFPVDHITAMNSNPVGLVHWTPAQYQSSAVFLLH